MKVGNVAHPMASTKHNRLVDWVQALLGSGVRVIMPEIADYEVRRELIRAKLFASVDRLNELREELEYAPLTTEVMDLAAELWADSRNNHTPTCDAKELDGDAILAAQAKLVGARVATDNIGHLRQWVQADPWQDIPVP